MSGVAPSTGKGKSNTTLFLGIAVAVLAVGWIITIVVSSKKKKDGGKSGSKGKSTTAR